MFASFGGSMLFNITATTALGVLTSGFVAMKYIFRNYPSFPISQLGTYEVAALKECRIKSKDLGKTTAQFQVFYPCNVSTLNGGVANSAKLQNNVYMRPNALEGLCRSLGDSSLLRYSLKNILTDKYASHLCDGSLSNVNVLKANDESQENNGWPVVLFSHGLFGTLELYTVLCREISSHGFIVVAPEHEDGSASYAEAASTSNDGHNNGNFDEIAIPYKRPSGVKYREKQQVVDFRKPFLEKRHEELTDLITALKEVATEGISKVEDLTTNDKSAGDLNTKIKHIFTESTLSKDGSHNSIILAGHSFGAASALYTNYRLQETKNDDKNTIAVKSLLLLDMWVSPVPDEVLSHRLTIPSLSVFCQDFVTWTPKKTPHELDGVSRFLNGNDNEDTERSMFQIKAIKETKHQFFADVPYWIPGFLSRFSGVSGQTDIAISRSCLEKLIVKFLLADKKPLGFDLTPKEIPYVYDVNETMLNPPANL